MSALLWPGDDRAGDVFSDAAVLAAMVRVEDAWLATLAGSGLAPTAVDLTNLVDAGDVATVAARSEAGGTPVLPLLDLLRERLRGRGESDAATWLHRGLTSQDTLDTALVLEARRTCAQLRPLLQASTTALAALARAHRSTPMCGRTLTQPAVPIEFGTKVAVWLRGLLAAASGVGGLQFAAQVGGAAGTLSGITVLTGGDQDRAMSVAAGLERRLDLGGRLPWHTERDHLARIGEAFVRVTTAAGRIANDVLTLSRPEIGELREGVGGGSSTMPHKSNPVMSTLIRRAALSAPADLGLLHLAGADTGDERPAGAWHVEWQPLQRLARHALVSASQTVDLVTGLVVDTDRMAANLAAATGLDAERHALGTLAGELAADAWAGADATIIQATVAQADHVSEGYW
ncbi:lyase family protein [Jatrophihabitans sp. YIM 134969]